MPINRIRLDDVDIRNITSTTSLLNTTLGQVQEDVANNLISTNNSIAQLQSDLRNLDGEVDTKANINSPTFTGTVTAGSTLITNEVVENYLLRGEGATGTLNINISDSSIHYYVNNSSANWTFNFRASDSVSLNTFLSGGQAVTATILITNGATPFRPTAFQVDGVSTTVRWADALVPASGNANSIDIYSFSILKTGNNTFVVLGSFARFA
jgi:hypothetical protein